MHWDDLFAGGMMVRMRSTAWLASAVAALALGACGGGGDDRDSLTTPGASEQPPKATPAERTSKVDPADVRVVRKWADTLRRGDIRGAARYFAIPSVVANGTAPLRITTRAHARFFNRTLPCGAKLIDTEPAADGFFIATFRLTERPGKGECGAGTGETARTAFRIRHGRITDWLRVEDVPEQDESLS
jgi:hypothetical protein